jgi:hypothetical protein
MGILTRKQGEQFVISSDHASPGARKTRAPRHLINEPYYVWTGAIWSSDQALAVLFGSLEDADDYVRMNYSKLSVTN